MLLGHGPHFVVGAPDNLVLGPLRALVGYAQQRLGRLAGACIHVGRHRLILGQRSLVQRVQAIGKIVEQSVYDFRDEPRLDGLDHSIGSLDGYAHQALGSDFLFDDSFAVNHHLLACRGWTQDFL